MRMMKRWLALIFSMSIVLSDCGGITVFATEDAIAFEESVSENSEESFQTEEDEDTVFDEMPDDEELISGETELPALHIGQMKVGEDLPSPDDSEFIYDLPVSFEATDSVLLFVNYNTEILEKEEKGTLVWSILRGARGMEEGSVGLVNEEDDWVGFEVVSDSPYFTMTENEDEESAYYQTVELTAKDTADHEDYNYYIRAAYYLGTGDEKSDEFYAAVTIPFLNQEGTDADMTPDDMPDAEEVEADVVQDDISGEDKIDTDTAPDEVSDAEETDSGEEQEEALVEAENNFDIASEDDYAENIDSELIDDDTQQDSDERYRELILDQTYIEMHPSETVQVVAMVVPEDPQAVIVWKSSDENVATVDANGEIRAKAEGLAQITAEYDGLTATARVEVTQANTDKIIDLSGDIWVAGFKRECDDFVYSGQKITQDIRVYHNETLLKENTDYTLSYKNNVNAVVYNAAKAPSVTITLKGQYSGSVTLYYTINPLDINNIDPYNADKDHADENDVDQVHSPGYEQAVAYSKNLKIPNPVLTFGKKKLTANKDFVCDYTALPSDYKNGDSYEVGKVYNYTVNGTGNFTGSFQMKLVIVKDKSFDFGSASVTFDQKQYEYHGTALSKSEVTIKELKLNKKVVETNLYDYEVCAKEIDGAYVMVYPTDAGRAAGYRGSKKVDLKLVGDRNIGDAAEGDKWQQSITFSQKELSEKDGIFQEKTGVLTYVSGTEKDLLTEGEDYTVKYSNAKKAGTATVTYTGRGRYKGTLKKKYEIKPNSDKANFTLIWNNVTGDASSAGGTLKIAYQKGGAVPDFVLKDQDNNVLKNKTDYTVKLTDNKNPGTAMSCEINGKGNYKGYSDIIQIMVTNGDISRGTISIPDKPYSTKANAWKSKVSIKDVNGKALTAGKDYNSEVIYKYTNMESGELPREDSVVEVTVHGMGCYEGSSAIGKYRIYKTSISKLKITIDDQVYTGNEIELSKWNIHVYASAADAKKKRELMEPCYEIVQYKNNIKAGTAKVTLRGIGNYGGTRTCSFKIKKKTYLINRVKGIKLNTFALSISLREKEKRTLIATMTSTYETLPIANPTVIWSTSNSSVATVETGSVDGATVTAVINAKKAGSVTITATTQDGNKKAQCKVTIVNAPVLKQAGMVIEKEEGETYQLEFETDGSQQVSTSGIEWESSNTEVVSVDKNGLLKMKKMGAAVIKVYSNQRKYIQQCYVIVKGDEVMPDGNYVTFHKKAGSLDDTKDIRNLIFGLNLEQYDGVYIPAGVYWIDAELSILMRSNMKLIMSPSALIMAIPNRNSNYHIILAFDCNNITISGGQIIGERNEHGAAKGEWGHGISIYDCKDVYISDVDISQCWGDGIYLGSYHEEQVKATSSHITITNCNVHNNRRNNLSITAADYVKIDKCQFNYAKGTDPQFGIDIETNNVQNPCEHITISNTTIKGNAKASMGIITPANDIRLENCKLSGAFYNMAGKNVVLHNTTIEGEVVDAAGGIRRE